MQNLLFPYGLLLGTRTKDWLTLFQNLPGPSIFPSMGMLVESWCGPCFVTPEESLQSDNIGMMDGPLWCHRNGATVRSCIRPLTFPSNGAQSSKIKAGVFHDKYFRRCLVPPPAIFQPCGSGVPKTDPVSGYYIHIYILRYTLLGDRLKGKGT